MNMNLKKYISVTTVLFLLAAALTGCGSPEIIEVSAPDSAPPQDGTPMDTLHPENAEIPEKDIETLLQAGIEATAEECDLWTISKITDTEVLMQLTQSLVGRERPEEENGERREDMAPSDEDMKQQHDTEKPERSGGNPPENKASTFPEGEMPEGGRRQPGNRNGETAALALAISGAEGTTLTAEDIFAHIQLTAEELGLKANSMELTEEQQAFVDVAEGYAAKMIVLIHVQPSEMRIAVTAD